MKWSIWGQNADVFISSFKVYMLVRKSRREIRLKHNTVSKERTSQNSPVQRDICIFPWQGPEPAKEDGSSV